LELALLFIVPKHQSTTIPPFLHKAKGPKARREENNMKAREISNVATGSQGEAQIENKLPKPHTFGKRGKL